MADSPSPANPSFIIVKILRDNEAAKKKKKKMRAIHRNRSIIIGATLFSKEIQNRGNPVEKMQQRISTKILYVHFGYIPRNPEHSCMKYGLTEK